jgi:hypothetical protein
MQSISRHLGLCTVRRVVTERGEATSATVYEVGTSLAPRGGVMVPPPLDEHLLPLSVS